VIVGAGATGTELAGSMADMIHETKPDEYRDLAVDRASVQVVDLGHVVLGGFSDRAHKYASKVLQERGVKVRLGTGVKEVAADHVILTDGTMIKTRCVGLGRRPDGCVAGRCQRSPAGTWGPDRRRA
jgi:NADH dehydrogenase